MVADFSGFVEAFVPLEIREHFAFEKLERVSGVYRIYMVEKDDEAHYPEELRGIDAEVVKAGYLNPIELQTFPLAGHEAFIYLCRRRWKRSGADERETYHNRYDFTEGGAKCTRAFGAFLKELYREEGYKYW